MLSVFIFLGCQLLLIKHADEYSRSSKFFGKMWRETSMDQAGLFSTFSIALLDFELGSLETKLIPPPPPIRYCVPQTIPKLFLQCDRVPYSAEKGHCYHAMLLSWWGVLGQQQYLGQKISQSITLTCLPYFHSASCCQLSNAHATWTSIFWKKHKFLNTQTIFFYCSVVQFWY